MTMNNYNGMLTKSMIWNIKQNKPSLIADDFEKIGIHRDFTHSVLLARGVYKWLSVRRLLIKTKNNWLIEINKTLSELKINKRIPNNQYRIGYLRGYLKAYENCRYDVRELCHSERWQAPDFDRESIEFLNKLGNE